MAEGKVTMTLEPTWWVLKDANGQDAYGLYSSEDEAKEMRVKLGNRVDPNEPPMPVLIARVSKPRGRGASKGTATSDNGGSRSGAAPAPVSAAGKAAAPKA